MNKNNLVTRKRVRTIHGSTIIQYLHNINIFGVQERFYENKNLKSDLLIGINFLNKIGDKIDIPNQVMKYNTNKTKKIHFLNNLPISNPLGQANPKSPAEENTGNKITKDNIVQKSCKAPPNGKFQG